MGEIMRWRLARPAQRRVPDPATALNLPNPFRIDPIIQAAQALNQPTIQQAVASYQKILSDPTTLRQYLSTANVCGNAGECENDGERIQLISWVMEAGSVAGGK